VGGGGQRCLVVAEQVVQADPNDSQQTSRRPNWLKRIERALPAAGLGKKRTLAGETGLLKGKNTVDAL